jgi:hypothetical protein
MRVTLVRSYRSKNGNVTFVYKVTGSKEQLAAFKESQGDFYREDEHGSPLWFTTRCIGKSGTLIITSNGNVVPDMSQFDQAASLAKQYGGDFGNELARAAAQSLVGGMNSTPAPQVPKPEPQDTPPDDDIK